MNVDISCESKPIHEPLECKGFGFDPKANNQMCLA